MTFGAEITDTEEGVEWIIRAPLGLVQRSVWEIVDVGEGKGDEGNGEGKGEGRLVLVEDVEISCSRLLVGTVRGKCEENWRGVHAGFVEKVVALG